MFTCRHAPLTIAPDVQRALLDAYSEPHRAYHTHEHIREMLRWFDWVVEETGWDQIVDVYLAVLFHDAVYDPLRTDNEERSAKLARELGGATDRTAELILLTAQHGKLDARTAGDTVIDRDAAHFLDCDMAILGAPAAEFDAYDAAIGYEYQHVAPDTYKRGRRAFLEKLIARPKIFLSPLFQARLEATARGNLGRVLARYA